jgi:D-3-phosphoglycerate dehydrogenase
VRILAVGDSYMPPQYFRHALAPLEGVHDVAYVQVDDTQPFVPATPAEAKLRELQGTPAEVAAWMPGVEVLFVHGAPVTERVLAASAQLRLVGCARGGPVNVDVEAATARGLPVVNTPGKNAEAVADLTLAFLVMLARGLPEAQRFLRDGHQLKDNWEGARFMGADLRGHTLGLVGYGHVGQRVARRAVAFGMTVVVFDPFLDEAAPDDVEHIDTLDELLAHADFVSLHARATADNAGLIDARALAAMKPGAFLVNTARETLVDEAALDDALASGHLGGVALDVFHPMEEPGRHPLLRHPNVVLTPQVGGATHETLSQGAEMLAGELRRFAAGEPLHHLVNPEVVAA